MTEGIYKKVWEELHIKMAQHWKRFPRTDLLSVPWNMMKEIEREHGISTILNKNGSRASSSITNRSTTKPKT